MNIIKIKKKNWMFREYNFKQCKAAVKQGGEWRQCKHKCKNGYLCGIHYNKEIKKGKIKLIEEYGNEYIQKIVKIQSIFRGNKIRKIFGPGLLHREKSYNKDDIGTCELVKDIKADDYFSFKDGNFIYSFTDFTFQNCIDLNKKNPYTNKELNKNIISNFNKKKEWKKKIKGEIKLEKVKLSNKQKLNGRIVDLFYNMNMLGNYSNSDYFLKLTIKELLLFYKYGKKVWNNKERSIEDKNNICPKKKPFEINLKELKQIKKIDDLREIILQDMEKLVFDGTYLENKKMGTWIILSIFEKIKNLKYINQLTRFNNLLSLD